MPKTRNELVERVLQVLRVKAEGQTPSAEDVALVTNVLAPVYAELDRDEVYGVQDDSTIDDEAFLPLAEYIATEVAPDFGLARDEDKRALAKSRLRRVSRADFTYSTLATNYF